MNRRRFFGALAGLAVVPAASALPVTESTWRFAQFRESKVYSLEHPAGLLPVADVGAFIRNGTVVPLGTAGERYVVLGWVYTKNGWDEVRCLTGE